MTFAWSYDMATPCRGAGRPAAASTFPNAPRSSARWMASGEVPNKGTPASLSRCARPSGVWPPSWTITPTTSGEVVGVIVQLGLDHLEHVFDGQRLEVQPVGGVVVGGDRLRIAVDHHGLVAGGGQREAGVHAGVVELDALADPVRPAAQDQHLAPAGAADLGLFVVGRVVVRRGAGASSGTGVYGLEHRPQAQ